MPHNMQAFDEQMDTNSLEFIFHHVFLPPRVPQKDDHTESYVRALVDTFHDSMSAFLQVEPTLASSIQPALCMIDRFIEMTTGSSLDVADQIKSLREQIANLKTNDTMLFHVRCQNAGLMLTGQEDGILVEAFELLAPNEAVMSCKGALVREFPDRAAFLPEKVVKDASFLDHLVDAIIKLDVEVAPVTRPKVNKDGRDHPEERDTISPALVTGMIIDIITGLGKSVEPKRVVKRSREQVNWRDTFGSFHRSPTWLLLRVATRLVLDRLDTASGEKTMSSYKQLMAYHHGRMLDLAARATKIPIPSDTLLTMQAKIARRVLKLDPTQDTAWLGQLNEFLKFSQSLLDSRWKHIQAPETAPLPLDKLPTLEFGKDCELRLRNFRQHLKWIVSRPTRLITSFGPGDITHFSPWLPSTLPTLDVKDPAMNLCELLEFESWVKSTLPIYVTNINGQDATKNAVGQIGNLIEAYRTRATSSYDRAPEALSGMYLVIMELWVAMDKIAGALIPLLLEFDPGFTPDLFYPLLLESKDAMTRLKDVERYLSERKINSPGPYPSAFEDFGKAHSFAVRYYQTSLEHHELRAEIEQQASLQKARKLEELKNLKIKYETLEAEYLTTECEKIVGVAGGQEPHSRADWYFCNRCRTKNTMHSLAIEIFEWPLPSSPTKSDAIIVEINLPDVVRTWRNVTWKLVSEIFGTERNGNSIGRGGVYYADSHSGLESFSPNTSSRVCPASTVKPASVSHYRTKKVPEATEDNVCVPHAAEYQYYDRVSDEAVTCQHKRPAVPPHCSYAELLKGQPVEHWVRHSVHTSNDILAGQADCPLLTSLDEFRAFGNLRSGTALQWANILCQLSMPSLDFNKPSTFALVIQAALEAGPNTMIQEARGSFCRDTHRDTQNPVFMWQIILALNTALDRIRESWQNHGTLALLSCLATRLVSLSPSDNISSALLEYLAKVRRVSVEWAQVLLEKLNRSGEEHDRQDWTQRVLMMALMCMTTYYVDQEHLSSILKDTRELGFFIQAAAMARTHLPPSGTPSDPIAIQLFHRWHATMHRARGIVAREIINNGNDGLDIAIKSFWADYSPHGPAWKLRDIPKGHIIERRNSERWITFNLLTGNLFVDGYPLSKLPPSYQQHKVFTELIGNQVLDVGPSSDPTMEFSSCRDQSGWILHFRMIDGHLVVRAVQKPTGPFASSAGKKDADIWEYIPRYHFKGDLTNSFVNNYAHWLNLSTREVEFRPMGSKWNSSPTNWRLTWIDDTAILKHGSRSALVIEPASATGQVVNQILGSIESPQDIDVTFSPNSKTLSLDLLRLGLTFSVIEGASTVESKNYTGMQVDENQALGTLVGLVHKLALKPVNKQGFRRTIVPRGKPSCVRSADDHVTVTIVRNNTQHGRHESFLVDDKLGQLVDSGSLHGKLYLCLLHAVTSHCLPDPLTLRTGTEEALRHLQGMGVRSYPSLDQDADTYLGQIASLSPRRQYYPNHLQVMEQTMWDNNLPPLSQHDAFWTLSTEIYSHYKTHYEIFRTEVNVNAATRTCGVMESLLKSMSPALAERASIRNSSFRVSEYGAEVYNTGHDTWYRWPDRKPVGSARNTAHVSALAAAIDTRETQLSLDSPCLKTLITGFNGDKFNSNPAVDITFGMDNFNFRESMRGMWCGLHRTFVNDNISKWSKILFLSSLLYAEDSNLDMVQILMALAIDNRTFSEGTMLPPSAPWFDLEVNRGRLHGILSGIVRKDSKSLRQCPEIRMVKRDWEHQEAFERRREGEWKKNLDMAVGQFVGEIMSQFELSSLPLGDPKGGLYDRYLNARRSMPLVKEKVELARRTDAFMTYLELLEAELRLWTVVTNTTTNPSSGPLRTILPPSKPRFTPALSLFMSPAPLNSVDSIIDCPRLEDYRASCRLSRFSQVGSDGPALAVLVDELSGIYGEESFQATYLAELRRSMTSPVNSSQVALPRDETQMRLIQSILGDNLEIARRKYNTAHSEIRLALSAKSTSGKICQIAGYFPRISPIFLLQRLTRNLWQQLSKQWRECLVRFALSLVALQRAERLHDHAMHLPQRWSDLERELSNKGDHDRPGWHPLEHPERLLLEIEQGILIRPVQGEIASVMRSPPNDKNAVMQLNMGEGKSSVIVPIVAAALADGNRLVRVVVAKPQSNQMIHMLIEKLGRLINRPVFYLPFSRSTRVSYTHVAGIRDIFQRCRDQGGVLLVQPEHILSFKLMGIEKSWEAEDDGNQQGYQLGSELIGLYQDFESSSRDIVDESDENFSVKFELIYTMGAQEPVELSPDRWGLIQEILDMTEIGVRELLARSQAMKQGILIEECGLGRVPMIRILDENMGRELVQLVATNICQRGLRGFQIHYQSAAMQMALLNYIMLESPSDADISTVEDPVIGLFSNPAMKKIALLLRGLFAKGVLLFTLAQKRYRVNYGLAPDRRPATMLAVPYRAKDMPSPRSEFSHPDVVIVLTCLSYYYGGLSDAELYTCMGLLSKSDQGPEEYGRWAVKSPTLPSSFHHFSAINLKDRPQCENIVFPGLRYTRATIDYYLSTVVFPKEMKQFPLKLSASGWDLGKQTQHPLTGFSGTNDSRTVLPLSVQALDLQPHTNAAVLETLLGEENTVLEIAGASNQSQVSALTEAMLLSSLSKTSPSMRVILDVGAQIIESSNIQMAKKFLGSVPTTEVDAVIYFNDHDELSVLTRNGTVDSFLTSPFLTQTHRCLVFLDQAHTRGTDLKLPDDYRAAVTLGPGVTKDTLVQACMRMRKLGKGQSVTFIVSPEMQKRIRDIRGISSNDRPLNVSDIIAWAIWETWADEERSVPLWAIQGIRHVNQERIWRRAELSGSVFSASHARDYLEPEALSLEKRYRPTPAGQDGGAGLIQLMEGLALDKLSNDKDGNDDWQLVAIKKKLAAFTKSGGSSGTSATLQEEQERELAPEIEVEAEVSRPPPRNALQHSLHRDVIEFVLTGEIPANSKSFLPAFGAMSETSASSLFKAPDGPSSFPTGLLVTYDFVKTVSESGPGYCSDSYQRGVQWVLLTTRFSGVVDTRRMVVISQWEANKLKTVIEKEQQWSSGSVPVKLHAYLPRANLTFQSMEDLDTYIIPDHTLSTETNGTPTLPPPANLIMELNLFAGQVYLRNYGEYLRLCRYLGIMHTVRQGDEKQSAGDIRAIDGFVGKKGYPEECPFDFNPVPFLAEVFKKIRRDCVGGIEKTHMGRILAGEILTERDFE